VKSPEVYLRDSVRTSPIIVVISTARNRLGAEQDVEFAVAVGDEVAAVVFEELGVVYIGAAAVFFRAVLDAVLDAVVVEDDLGGFPDDACWALGVAEFAAHHHTLHRA